jgi:signal peptidase
LGGLTVRQAAHQLLQLLTVVSSALMIWKGLAVALNTESPIVVVLSESMEPAFKRGDLLFLALTPRPIETGDITVYKLKGRDIPIVHRVIKTHDDKKTGKQFILTKGDNNPVDDRGLYNRGQEWLHRDHIMGRVVGHVPYVGMLTILMNDYPWLKVAMVGTLALFILTSKEQQ